ncbi:MAG: recombinase family protein [Clostridia bacterium]|nr:recombinase family protein [Clostridia bacterium]
MKTAVIYARYSCDKQTEQSIDGQLRVCQDYAQRNDIMIINTYIDQAISGTTDNRPDFQRMIKDSAKKAFEFVLVYKLDRFSRDKFAATMYKHTLKQNGVRVLSAMENIPDTPEGIILESLLEGMNQYYSAELSQKVKRGMKETRLKGFYQGGGVPYGYKIDGRKLVIDEERAENVRFMYDEFSKGVIVKDLIKQLTAMGKTYRGKPFAMNTVYNILRNEKYIGIYRINDEVLTNMYPQIIDEPIYNRVNAILQRNKRGSRSQEINYLLKHKLKCGYCGNNINGEYAKSHTGADFYYYKCRGRKMKLTDCNKSTIQKDTLENLIIDFTVEQLSEPQNIEAIINNLLAIQERNLKVNSTLIALQKEQREIETAIDNTMKAIAQGVITKTTTQYLKQYEERQEEITKLIVVEQSKETVTITEKEIRKYYQDALRLEPQMLVNYLIKEITLFDNRADIYYNSPIKSTDSPDNSQGFSFYSKSIRLGHKLMIVTLFIR